MAKTTEQLINSDGKIDEKAAGAEIDAVMQKMNGELAEVAADEQETQPEAEAEVEAKAEEPIADDESGSEDWTEADDMKELMESLGYSDDDVSEFGSRDELNRHVRLMDREMKRNRPGDDQERALEADEISRQKNERADKTKEQYREDGKFAKKPEQLPELDPDEFDPRLIDAMKARDAKIAELEAKINDSGQNNILSDFDGIVDDLGHDELFGNSEDLKPAQKKERAKLFEEYKELYNFMESRGKPVSGKGVNRSIVLRALNLEFADEIKNQNRRNITKKVKRQAKKITGSSHRQSSSHYDGPVENDPYLKQAFNDMIAENG